MLLMCLGIGLVLRDLQAVQFEFGEEGLEVDESLQHLQDSALGWGQCQSLLRECQRLRTDILICCEVDPAPKTPLPEDSEPEAPKSVAFRRQSSRRKAAVKT
jgi:hypothetical protein